MNNEMNKYISLIRVLENVPSGTVIVCETEEEASFFLSGLHSAGYSSDTGAYINWWPPRIGDYLVWRMGKYRFVSWKESWKYDFYSRDTYDIIKFVDLAAQDSPINSPIDSPIHDGVQPEDDILISRKELFGQIRSYLEKTACGEATAETELRIGEIASIIMSCPEAKTPDIRDGMRRNTGKEEQKKCSC